MAFGHHHYSRSRGTPCNCTCHEGDWIILPIVLFVVSAITWTVFTFAMWASGSDTLVHVIAGEWRWAIELLHRIY